MGRAATEHREVTWNVLDIPVSGTITAPADHEASSAVILVAGSGPTDRLVLTRVHEPVLVVIAQKDIQAGWKT